MLTVRPGIRQGAKQRFGCLHNCTSRQAEAQQHQTKYSSTKDLLIMMLRIIPQRCFALRPAQSTFHIPNASIISTSLAIVTLYDANSLRIIIMSRDHSSNPSGIVFLTRESGDRLMPQSIRSCPKYLRDVSYLLLHWKEREMKYEREWIYWLQVANFKGERLGILLQRPAVCGQFIPAASPSVQALRSVLVREEGLWRALYLEYVSVY